MLHSPNFFPLKPLILAFVFSFSIPLPSVSHYQFLISQDFTETSFKMFSFHSTHTSFHSVSSSSFSSLEFPIVRDVEGTVIASRSLWDPPYIFAISLNHFLFIQYLKKSLFPSVQTPFFGLPPGKASPIVLPLRVTRNELLEVGGSSSSHIIEGALRKTE